MDVALHEAAGRCDTNEVRRLISEGADLNAQDGQGMTALHAAAYGGCVETVRALLEAGADPTLETLGSFPLRPAHLARAQGHLEVVALLVKYNAG